LKATKEKYQVSCKGKPIRITADYAIETIKTKRHEIRNLEP
jgi:hypothetical protein